MPEPQMLIPFSRQKFDAETGDLVDEETRGRLRRFLSALAEWIQRFEEPVKVHRDRPARGYMMTALAFFTEMRGRLSRMVKDY